MNNTERFDETRRCTRWVRQESGWWQKMLQSLLEWWNITTASYRPLRHSAAHSQTPTVN